MERETPEPEYLKWLVDIRSRNQLASAKLYKLLKDHPNQTKKFRGSMRYDAQTLVAIAFSLWRSAFLSGRSNSGTETAHHAEMFLGEMLETNAINFPQDKNSRNWTFNYYTANARNRLLEYAEDNPSFDVDKSKLERGSTLSPKARWVLFQDVFDEAVEHFAGRLKRAKSISG